MVHGETGRTLEDLYPGLDSEIFKSATPAKLLKETLLISGGLTIKESEIVKVISQSEPSVRKQLTQNAFFLLENMATKGLFLQETRKGRFIKGDEDKSIANFHSEKIKISAVSEEELKNFHYFIATPFLTT